MVVRVSTLVVLAAVAGLVELSIAADPCDLECVLDRLADLEQQQRESAAENRELRQIISEQQSTIDAQDQRIYQLEKTVTSLHLQAQDQDDQSKNDDDASRKTERSKSVTGWQPRHIAARDEIKPRGKRQERAGIAFSVYLDHNADLANHQTIKFNKIILDEGNIYNIHSGVFTCPESGVYLLTFSVGGRDGRNLRVNMVKNSANMVDANADSMHGTQELQGGNTVIARLHVNDVVWLEAAEPSTNIEGGGNRLSTFSGVYLYA